MTSTTGRAASTSAADGRIRLVAGLALFALAAITAIVSYLHALAVVRSVGNTGAVAYLIPFVADLMIVSASMALLEAARNSASKPALAIVSLVFGIGATAADLTPAVLHRPQTSSGWASVDPSVRASTTSRERSSSVITVGARLELVRASGRS